MAQQAKKPVKEKQLVFEKVKFDPLTNPALFGIGIEDENEVVATSPVNVDSGWNSDEERKEAATNNEQKPKPKAKHNEEHSDNDNDDNEEEYNYDNIEANIQRAKKKKKVDFRAEMTSDSQDIDDLLIFQSNEKNEQEKIQKIDEELLDVNDEEIFTVASEKKKKEKSIKELMQETDNMFKDIQSKQDDITTKDLDLDLNVDDNFNFDAYINNEADD
eukprot:CAMPEP_0197077438 /NCGR_PEP_ID=MMETSP1384-20130603/212621_1 /TAXON_ID=29189 /ORGANISM="Ammonia sp." /LENGTH=216 /DNA_ID=CAMNT_0042516305 /DNA_START=34 /DNA_END=684 /DNA_ORIENTATION=+